MFSDRYATIKPNYWYSTMNCPKVVFTVDLRNPDSAALIQAEERLYARSPKLGLLPAIS